MRYLLDVNALVALGFLQHEFHERVAHWVRALASKGAPELVTRARSRTRFRTDSRASSAISVTVAHARTLLLRLKAEKALKFAFISDDHDVSHLPGWVKTAKQTTDGHLEQLAKANDSLLATLDGRIPKAFLIPARK